MIGTSGNGPVVIAEAGVNHNGEPDLAHKLVDVAAASGASAVKFQTFDPSLLATRDAARAPYQGSNGVSSQRDMLAGLTLPESAWPELAEHARSVGVDFLSTAFDERSLELVLACDVPALKIPSGELTNLAFIEFAAGAGLPLILSTGLGTMDEVSDAVEAARAAPQLAIMHCVSAYPAPVSQANLLAIPTMRKAFDCPVGWSDHTEGTLTGIAAVALGARLLEKHVTTDRSLPGPDHRASADPAGLQAYVEQIKLCALSLGTGIKEPQPAEEPNRHAVRRSWHLVEDVDAGAALTPADAMLLRPADGLPPTTVVIGRVATRKLFAGDPVHPGDVE